MKKVFEKVFISKVFVRKTTHRLHVHIFENNKKDGASDTELAKKEGSRKGLRQQSFLGRGGTAKRAHFRLCNKEIKKVGTSDVKLEKPGASEKVCEGKAFWGEEEQRNERTFDFVTRK